MRQIEDHSPSQYPQNRDCVLLVSFDELAEIGHHSWIRDATPEEIKGERERLESPYRSAITGEVIPGRQDFDALSLDGTGRLYQWVVVTREAPGHIWRQATGHLRILRFQENG